jgi:hypothetical protein
VSLKTELHHDASHTVLFYGDDAELTDAVTTHLLPALRRGGTAVVAGTAGHAGRFASGLGAAGIDWDRAVAEGRLLTLDAAAVAADLIGGGRIDPSRFEARVAKLLARAAAGGGPVRVFGEIVAVLWDRGEPAAAFEVESLWNELLERLPFDLLCAYRASIQAGPVTVADVCAAHSKVDGTVAEPVPPAPRAVREVASRSFRGILGDAANARHFVTQVLGSHGPAGVAEPAAVVVTELATNAVLHAGTPFTVTILARPRGVRVVVTDGSPRLPVRREAGSAHPGGRGLRLVDALSADWGAHLAADGAKQVWAEFVG